VICVVGDGMWFVGEDKRMLVFPGKVCRVDTILLWISFVTRNIRSSVGFEARAGLVSGGVVVYLTRWVCMIGH
jgi:hypothetical protein